MKVFLSTELDDKAAHATAKEGLLQGGHTLSHDWSVTEILPPDFANNAEKAKAIALINIEGVLTCDAFMILTSNEVAGHGMYAELGAALVRAEAGQLDHVLVIGERRHETVFYYHPQVRHFNTIAQGLEYINACPDGE